MGTLVEVEDLRNQTQAVVLKAGTVQPFGEVRVKGAGIRKMAQFSVEGMLDKAFRRSGDLVIVTEVEFPDRLTEKQREAVQRLF